MTLFSQRPHLAVSILNILGFAASLWVLGWSGHQKLDPLERQWQVFLGHTLKRQP